MSRLKHYSSALGASYFALAANVAYTLASVPLALKYLSKAEFALWGLSAQMAGYAALIDFGMTGVSRILIDHKDRKNEPTYGSVIQTSVIVNLVQAVLIAMGGVALAFGLGPVVGVPEGFQHQFVVLVIGQCGLIAAGFATRIFMFLLAAHQRQDVWNYAQGVLFGVNLAVLWLCLAKQMGVYSTLWAQFCTWALLTLFMVWACIRWRVFPHPGYWGRPSWAQFREFFAYGRDIFLFVVGAQLVNASQVILITRQLGLEAAAVWVVCSRTYLLATQLIFRIFDLSVPALAEMMVRGEDERLQQRFRSIVVVSGSVSVVAGVIFALCNQPFVQLWTHGKTSWPVVNDVLLAWGLFFSVIAHSHVGLVGQTKQFRFLRFISIFEGLWLVGCSLLFMRWGGISALIVAGISGTLLFSFPYSTWRTAEYFKIGWRDAAVNWAWPSVRLALLLVPIGGAVFIGVRQLPALAQLIAGGIATGGAGAFLFFRYGLDSNLRAELYQRLPISMRSRWLVKA